MYLLNAFSLQMVDVPCECRFSEVDKLPEGLESAVGHVDTAAESGGVVRAISQAELIKLDPKYFGKHNTFEIDGITVARFNSTNMVGAIIKKYTYKMYVIMYDNVKKQLLTKRFATIKP